MQQVGISELKNQTTEILRNVREARAEYIVTVRGEPVARLLPVDVQSPSNRSKSSPAELYSRQALADQIEQTLLQNKDLHSSNRQMLEIYRDWLKELNEEDDEKWWDEFDAELQKNRFSLRQEPI